MKHVEGIAFVVGIILLCVLFGGEPDLADAIMDAIRCDCGAS